MWRSTQTDTDNPFWNDVVSWKVRAGKAFGNPLMCMCEKTQVQSRNWANSLLVSTEVRPEPWVHGWSLVLFIFPLHGKPTWISFKPWGCRPVPMVLAPIESKSVFQAQLKHCSLFCLPHPLCNCSQPPVDQRFGYTLECQDTGCHGANPTWIIHCFKGILELWLSKG